MIEEIENKILDTLKNSGLFKGFDIKPFPEDFDSYSFLSAKGCLLVRYDGSIFSDPETLTSLTQSETYEFSVIAGIRYQDTLSKNYPVLENIKNELKGLRVREGRLYPKKRMFLGQKNRSSYYGYVFAVKLKSFDSPKNSNVIDLFEQ